ncbi:MAG: N-acetylneuraminic acid mutarotase [Crocinitomicaceae bacterium]|jgi:N-acetylneuraminic acid mutarotase
MKLTLQLIIALFITNGMFAQTENYWTKKADFGGLKRERAVAFTVGNEAFVGTGIDTMEVVLDDFWKYDVTLDAWTQVASIPGSIRRNAVAFSIGNFGYVGTGMDFAVASDFGSSTLDDFWQYDPVGNLWSAKASYPGGFGGGLYFATGFAIGGKGYICGGKMGPNNYTSEFWEYDQSLDQWAQLANFPGGVRYQLSSFTIDNVAYVGFGTDQDIYRKDIWAYDVTTSTWTAKNDFPASERASSTTFTIGQRGYVCMGANGGILDDLWQYNPFTDGWSVKANYGGTARKNAIAFSLDGKGYVGIGKGYSGKKQSMWEYTPNTGLGLNENLIDLSIYPNPTSDYLHISSPVNTINAIELYSITGKMVYSGEYNQTIDVRDLQSGSYILFAKEENGSVIAKHNFIIQ